MLFEYAFWTERILRFKGVFRQNKRYLYYFQSDCQQFAYQSLRRLLCPDAVFAISKLITKRHIFATIAILLYARTVIRVTAEDAIAAERCTD